MITFIPVTVAELPAGWVADRRELVAREGRAVQGGVCPQGFTIEIKSLVTNEWKPLGWHHGAICFADQGERDEVIRQLVEVAE